MASIYIDPVPQGTQGIVTFSHSTRGNTPHIIDYILTLGGAVSPSSSSSSPALWPYYLGSYNVIKLWCNITSAITIKLYGPNGLTYIMNQGVYETIGLISGTYTLVLTEGCIDVTYTFDVSISIPSEYSLRQSAGNWIFTVSWNSLNQSQNLIQYTEPSTQVAPHFTIYGSSLTQGQAYQVPLPLTISQTRLGYSLGQQQIPQYILDGKVVPIPTSPYPVTVPLSPGKHSLTVGEYTILFTVVNTPQPYTEYSNVPGGPTVLSRKSRKLRR